MIKEILIKEIKSSQEFFERSTRVLSESDSMFKPAGESFTVAQQFEHVADTIHWFLDGALSSQGFDLNFEEHCAKLQKVTSLTNARASLNHAYEMLISKIQSMSEQDLMEPMADSPVMGGEPRYYAFLSVVEHTAHHRGALTIYTRLLKKVPLMPYMEM